MTDRRPKLGALVAMLVVLVPSTSCSTRAPDRPISSISETPARAGEAAALDRRFDLANARWYHAGKYYQLHNGYAEFSPDPKLEHYPQGDASVQLDGDPLYLDLDRDGDLDAAATLDLTSGGGGNGFSRDVYLWLWNGKRAEQVHLPVFSGGRCGDELSKLGADPDGLRIDALLFAADSSCAEGGTIPVSLVVSMVDGFPARRHPRLSAAAVCNPVELTDPLTPGAGPVARVAPDVRAPVLPSSSPYRNVWIGSRTETDPRGVTWHLALLEHADKTTDCGWIAGR
jgi:hypothetical protein